MNKIHLGDCLDVLKTLRKGTADLIYLDPPFFSQKVHVLATRSGKKYYNFSDQWTDMSQYIQSVKQRLLECRNVLSPTGSIFVHCDKSASHYLKMAMDEIFGTENFQSEIIWTYRRWSNAKKGLQNHHQTILFYSKSAEFKFKRIFESYSNTTNVDQIVQMRSRDARNKSVYKKDAEGIVELSQSKAGVPMGDVWDIPFLNPKARERVGYPTQKPILLLERIIKLVTDEGDIVLDPYCGSGSMLVAAKILNRRYIGIDKNKEAVQLAKKRLITPVKSESRVLTEGRASYDRSDAKVKNVVRDLKATLVQRNSGIDGLISMQNQIVPFKVVFEELLLMASALQLEKSTRKNQFRNRAIFFNSRKTAGVRKIEKDHGVIVFRNLEELNKKMIK